MPAFTPRPAPYSTSREVFVLTQERLHLLQHQDPSFSANLTFVDEAQKFGDDARGVLLQQVLDESVSRRPDGQVVFASPLSDNPELLLEAVPDGTSSASLVGGTVTVTQNLFSVNQVRNHPQRWTVEMMTDRGATSIGEVTLPARPSPASKRLPLLAVTLGEPSSSQRRVRQRCRGSGEDERARSTRRWARKRTSEVMPTSPLSTCNFRRRRPPSYARSTPVSSAGVAFSLRQHATSGSRGD